MKRPLWIIGVSLLTSILVGFLCTFNLALSISVALCALGIMFALTKLKNGRNLAVVLLSLGIGIAIGGYNNKTKIEPFEAYKGENLRVIGVITEVYHSSQRSTRLTLKASFPDTNLPDSTFIIRDYLSSDLDLGNKIDCVVKFADSKYDSINQRYRQQSIPGEGSFVAAPMIIENIKEDSFTLWLLSTRENIRNKIDRVLPEKSSKIVSTMVFGLKEDLDSQIYLNLAKTGTIHVLSVSGMHLTIFTMFLMFIMQALKIPEKLSIFIAIVANIAFAVLVGFSVPIVRAAIMAIMFLLAKLIGRDNDSLTALGLSLIVISILWPHWVLTAGMWLSALSTAGIIILGVPLKKYFDGKLKFGAKWQRALATWFIASISVTISASLFTFPLITFMSGYLSTISIVANLLIEPFTSIIVVVGIALAALPTNFLLYPLLRWLVDFSVNMMLEITATLSRLPFATLPINSTVLFIGFIVTVGLIAYAIIKKDKKSVLSAMLISIALLSAGSGLTWLYSYNNIEISTVANTSSAVLIRGENSVVIGTPDKYEVSTLIEYLSYKGIKNIDCLVINDHGATVGSSLIALKNNFNISVVIGPDDKVILKELAKVLPGVQVHSPQYVNLEFLGGAAGYIDKNSHNVNLVVGAQKIVITDGKYDIIKDSTINYIVRDTGEIVTAMSVQSDPISKIVFGESSITIKLKGE